MSLKYESSLGVGALANERVGPGDRASHDNRVSRVPRQVPVRGCRVAVRPEPRTPAPQRPAFLPLHPDGPLAQPPAHPNRRRPPCRLVPEALRTQPIEKALSAETPPVPAHLMVLAQWGDDGGYSRTPKPSTLNPKPEIWNPEPQIRNPEPQTRNEPGTPNPKPGTRDPKPGTWNPKSETRDTKLETWNLEPGNPNPKPETLNPEPQIRNPKPGSRKPKAESRYTRSRGVDYSGSGGNDRERDLY